MLQQIGGMTVCVIIIVKINGGDINAGMTAVEGDCWNVVFRQERLGIRRNICSVFSNVNQSVNLMLKIAVYIFREIVLVNGI